ncbi:hypothetical protein ABEB36_007765 [Hypothenemus hampei]|uniref:Peroxisome assembly protein 12 n=1 Tax=Hypothenemus hampei TaxID=57062 RepID=A0ABD1EV58_HYPHA
MAVNAANFTTTFQNKPSIFEILAQKSLNETLHPAFQKVALFLSSNFPRKFWFLNSYGEEAFACINGVLQFYYLKYYDASFSENFYGLKRLLLNGKPLAKHERELSLIFLVAVPYFKRKVEEKLEIYRIEQAEGSLKQDFEGKTKKCIIYAHALFELMWTLVTLHNYLQYMADKTDIQQPLLHILKLKLTYSNEEPSIGFWSALFKGNLKFSDFSLGLMKNAVSTIFETSAFFLQFLQTWNAQKPNFAITDLPRVEPPSNHAQAEAFVEKCPICLQKWNIPTVLPISGYVFCFKCIIKHLGDTRKCPVTNLPANPLDVVRLYTND